MLVTALKPGYHGKLREVGDTFDVPSGSKASWFQPVTPDKAPNRGKRSKNGDDGTATAGDGDLV